MFHRSDVGGSVYLIVYETSPPYFVCVSVIVMPGMGVPRSDCVQGQEACLASSCSKQVFRE